LDRSEHPSTVAVPNDLAGPLPVLDFLCRRFPRVARGEWERRLADGGVLDERGRPLSAGSPCVPGQRLSYFRENRAEPVVPFAETILFRDEHLLVADKPHFLPAVPAGRFVEECLLARLRRSTGLAGLAPLHRIDRETAGLVLFSVNPESRGLYADLFRTGAVEKEYEALSGYIPPPGEARWEVADRLERGEPFFRMKRVPGPVNARTAVELAEVKEGRARFLLRPLTGRKHQIRVHMANLGFGIENDRFYPDLKPETPDDFSSALQLLARRVRFRDPLWGGTREFSCRRELRGRIALGAPVREGCIGGPVLRNLPEPDGGDP